MRSPPRAVTSPPVLSHHLSRLQPTPAPSSVLFDILLPKKLPCSLSACTTRSLVHGFVCSAANTSTSHPASTSGHWPRVFLPAHVPLPQRLVPATQTSKTDRWSTPPWTRDVRYATSITLVATIPQVHDHPSCQPSDILHMSLKTDMVYTTTRLLLLPPPPVRSCITPPRFLLIPHSSE